MRVSASASLAESCALDACALLVGLGGELVAHVLGDATDAFWRGSLKAFS